MPGTPDSLTKPSAWTTAAGNTVLATPERIRAMNAQMDKATFGDSIQDLGATISGDKLTGYVNSFGMDEDQYIQGAPISHTFAAQLVQDAKANIRPTNTVKYGVVVDRVDLRSFPTLQRAFDSASDTQFDNWQETAVDPATPVRVYHTNPQGNFIFVRTPHYRGWVPRNKVAITDAKTWQTYAAPDAPAVVTGRILTLQAGSQPQLYQMGGRHPHPEREPAPAHPEPPRLSPDRPGKSRLWSGSPPMLPALYGQQYHRNGFQTSGSSLRLGRHA